MRTQASSTDHDKHYTDFHSTRGHESPASSDKENEPNGRPTRHRRVSAREAQRLQDEEERAERKARKAAKKVEQARKKQLAAAALTAASVTLTQRPHPPSPAGNESNNSDSNDDDNDDANKYMSRTVQARPQMIKALAQRNQRVPQPAVEDSDSEDQSMRRHSSKIGRIQRIETPEEESPPPRRPAPHHPRSFSRPSSPDAGAKRSRSVEDDFRSTKEPKRQSGVRPKQADYSSAVQEVISTAIQLWRIKIFCENAFPTVQQETVWVTEVWQQASAKHQVPQALDMDISRLITSRTSHTRGEVKTKVKAFVPSMFDLESSQHPKIIQKMRNRAERLKDGYNFVYKSRHQDQTKRSGLYKGKIIQKCVNAIWFANRRDEGVLYPEHFSPMPLPALALVFAAIENCIDEWITGIHTSLDFTATEYEVVYKDHLSALQAFQTHARQLNILGNICTRLYNTGRFHSGAQPLENIRVPAISLAAFDAAIDEYNKDSATETDGEDGDLSSDEEAPPPRQRNEATS